MPDDNGKSKSKPKSSALVKFFWSALDRTFFIAMGVVGTVAGAYFTGLLKVNPPELVLKGTYSTIDASRPVANAVGNLKLNYKADAPRSYGVLRVDVANEGRGPAEGVRLQVKVPPALVVAYDEAPDFKVYKPESMTLGENEFYVELAHFPSGANDVLALRIDGDAGLLCGARLKFVNDAYEAKGAAIAGLEACP